MAENTNTTRGGMGFIGWLTILFVFLKLNPGDNFTTAIADWSWWWVLSPLWITTALGIVVLVVALVVALVIDNRRRKKARAKSAARRNRLN